MELNKVLLNKFGWDNAFGWNILNGYDFDNGKLINQVLFDDKFQYAGWSFHDLSNNSKYLLFEIYDLGRNSKDKKIIGYKAVSISENENSEKCLLLSDIKTNSELFRFIIDNKAFCQEYKRNYEITSLLK